MGKTKPTKYDNYTKEQLIAKLQKLEKQRYGLVWEDKPEEVAKQCETELPVLAEVKDKAINKKPDESTHYIIEGDNYHSLYTLNFTHKKKIDVIYIDPPYNTGKKDEWKYNDYWIDENDRWRHSKWLSFMNKRLRLARALLKDDGLILISIDDNELAQLKMLCNKIFGERNFVGQWHWFKSATPPNLSKKIKKNIEYIIGYEKHKTSSKYKGIKKYSKSDDPIVKPQNTFKDLTFQPNQINFKTEKAVIKPGIYGTKKYPNELLNELIIDNFKNVNEVTFRNRFIWTQGKLEEEIENSTKINCSKSLVISYKKSEYSEEVPPNLIDESVGVDTTEEAGKKLTKMFGKKVFDYPKSVSLMKYLLSFREFKNDQPIILDFFAGSGSTGQAVLELNKEDNGNRQVILCTNNENQICEEVTYPRVQKVINGYADVNGIPANVKYFKTDFVPNVKTDNDKRVLVAKSTELLCLAEDTFDVVKQNTKKKDFAIFQSASKLTAIIYDEDSIAKCVTELNKLNTEKETVIYVFSYDHTYAEEDFYSLKKPFVVKPIPEAILNVYRKAQKISKK